MPTPWAFSSRDHAEEAVDLLVAERGRRLVHDQDAGVGPQGPGDLDELLLGHRQPADLRVGVDRRADPLEQAAGPGRAARPSARAARLRPAPARSRCSRRRSGPERAPAADRSPRSPARATATGSRSSTSWPWISIVPSSGTMGAGDHLDQRRLARAVLADQARGLRRRAGRTRPL